MAKRSTRIEVTKVYKDGRTETTLNKNKMNRAMCEEVITRLSDEWNDIKKENNQLDNIIFRCVD